LFVITVCAWAIATLFSGCPQSDAEIGPIEKQPEQPGEENVREGTGEHPQEFPTPGAGCPSFYLPNAELAISQENESGAAFELLDSTYSENDLFKFGNSVATITLTGLCVDYQTPRVSLFIDEEVFHVEDGDPVGSTSSVTIDVPLPAHLWSEGEHTLNVLVDLPNDDPISITRDIRVLLNVASLAYDPYGRLWVGTFEFGLLVYSLGADPMDPSDDEAFSIPLRNPSVDYSQEVQLETFVRDSNSALAVAWDPSLEGVWVGTFIDGLFYVAPAETGLGGTLKVRYRIPGCGESIGYPCGEDRFIGDGGVGGQVLQKALANTITAIVPDGGTGLWLGTLEGLVHFDHAGTPLEPTDDSWTVFASEGVYDPNISRLAMDSAGRVWIASFDLADENDDSDSLVVLDPGGTPWYKGDDQWGHFPWLEDMMPNKLYTVAIDPQGLVWVGTTDGLFAVDHGGTPFNPADDQWSHRDANSGLPDNDIGVVVPRADGSLWVGGFDVCEQGTGGGLSLLDLGGSAFGPCSDALSTIDLPADELRQMGAMSPQMDCFPVTYTTDDGLIDADVASLVELPGGQVVIGTFNLLSASAIATTIMEHAPSDLDECVVERTPDPEFDPPTPSTTVGNDGLSVIDQAGTPSDKSDDIIVNL